MNGQVDLVGEYEAGSQYLGSKDPVMEQILKVVGPLKPLHQNNHFKSLVINILSQQLSTKSSATIIGRLESMINDVYLPEKLLSFTQEQYRSIGVSRQKYTYIGDLSRAFIEDRQFFEKIAEKKDDEIVSRLVNIKGIGIWTAQMFLMFSVSRINVFAPNDVGLRNAIEKWYGIEKRLNHKELDKFAERWQPYRTIASRYLWKSLDKNLFPDSK